MCVGWVAEEGEKPPGRVDLQYLMSPPIPVGSQPRRSHHPLLRARTSASVTSTLLEDRRRVRKTETRAMARARATGNPDTWELSPQNQNCQTWGCGGWQERGKVKETDGTYLCYPPRIRYQSYSSKLKLCSSSPSALPEPTPPQMRVPDLPSRTQDLGDLKNNTIL